MTAARPARAFRANDDRSDRLDAAIDRARDALIALQKPAGDWCFEFEADCTIPAETILMMHFMDEIRPDMQARLAKFIRAQQVLEGHGGWPQYRNGAAPGALDLSCTVKSYYALKCAGDDPEASHMQRARAAILERGGAAKANVFTRILLAMFRQVPWKAAPYVPVEIMLFPRWFPFEIYKVSSWARTVMVPLFILCSLKAQAKNPNGVHIRELFVRPPEQETQWFRNDTAFAKLFLVLDKLGRTLDRVWTAPLRKRAIRKAEAWFMARLNGEDGLNGIFPAMVNAYEAMALLGYPKDHPERAACLRGIYRLVHELPDGSAYTQPCLSPTWDTGWAIMALLHADSADGISRPKTQAAVQKAIDWLLPRQILDHTGDWIENAQDKTLRPGGWAFQYWNKYYPDLDDTAVIAGVLHLAGRRPRGVNAYTERTARAAEWLLGLQSKNGGFGAYDADNTHHWINSIPFADHKAMLDPPTEDVSGRVLAYLGVLKRDEDRQAIARCVKYLKQTQQPDGCWWGRWGTNYIYGTWSALAGLALVGEKADQPYIAKALVWLRAKQNADGGWGETNDSYIDPALRGTMNGISTPNSTAWALLAFFAFGDCTSDAVLRGIDWLLAQQCDATPTAQAQARGEAAKYAGLWHDPGHNAPGFPRVFYMKYFGYDAYFPLWTLARYRQLRAKRPA